MSTKCQQKLIKHIGMYGIFGIAIQNICKKEFVYYKI